MEQEIAELKARIKYYEEEQKHPIKFNRELQKENKQLREKINELNKLLDLDSEPVEQFSLAVPDEKIEGENPALEAFYRKSFSKPNPLKDTKH